MACPAIAVSFGPIGEAECHFYIRGGVHRSTVPGQDGVEAGAECVDQYSWRGEDGLTAYLGVGHSRDHDAVAAQQHLRQTLSDGIRLLAHDERADVLLKHINLFTGQTFLRRRRRFHAPPENPDRLFPSWGTIISEELAFPDPKSCSIQKQNSGMIFTSPDGGCADEKVTIHRRADCLCPEAG